MFVAKKNVKLSRGSKTKGTGTGTVKTGKRTRKKITGWQCKLRTIKQVSKAGKKYSIRVWSCESPKKKKAAPKKRSTRKGGVRKTRAVGRRAYMGRRR